MPVIFDMDGVLIDSELHWKRVEGLFLQGLIPSWTDADQNRILGMSIHDVYRALCQDYGLTISKAEFFGYYNSLALKLYGTETNLLPDALETVVELAAAGIRCAVCSSSPKPWIEIVIDRFALKRYLSAVASADDVEGVGKPSPRIYQYVAAVLNCEPAACVALEDTDKGLESAKAAGLRTVGIRNGFNQSQSFAQADREFQGFSAELRGFLRTFSS